MKVWFGGIFLFKFRKISMWSCKQVALKIWKKYSGEQMLIGKMDGWTQLGSVFQVYSETRTHLAWIEHPSSRKMFRMKTESELLQSLELLNQLGLPFLNRDSLYNVTYFLNRSSENILQHSGGQGLVLFNRSVRSKFYFSVFDQGNGFVDKDQDGIPDILEALQDRVSLDDQGCHGTGLSTAVRMMDHFELYSNGYRWSKVDPDRVFKSEDALPGSFIFAYLKLTNGRGDRT